MNICSVFFHLNNKEPRSIPIVDIISQNFQMGQSVNIAQTSKELLQQQGEIFNLVCLEENLVVAKKIENVTYFLSAEDISKSTDDLDVDVFFVAETNDLTKTISDIFENVKKYLSKTNLSLSYRKKEVKVYKVDRKDIDKNALHVTATFENKKREKHYEDYELIVMIILAVIALIVAIYYRNNSIVLGVAVSALVSIVLACVSAYIKIYLLQKSVRITDFTNIFDNDDLTKETGDSEDLTPYSAPKDFEEGDEK